MRFDLYNVQTICNMIENQIAGFDIEITIIGAN